MVEVVGNNVAPVLVEENQIISRSLEVPGEQKLSVGYNNYIAVVMGGKSGWVRRMTSRTWSESGTRFAKHRRPSNHFHTTFIDQSADIQFRLEPNGRTYT